MLVCEATFFTLKMTRNNVHTIKKTWWNLFGCLFVCERTFSALQLILSKVSGSVKKLFCVFKCFWYYGKPVHGSLNKCFYKGPIQCQKGFFVFKNFFSLLHCWMKPLPLVNTLIMKGCTWSATLFNGAVCVKVTSTGMQDSMFPSRILS